MEAEGCYGPNRESHLLAGAVTLLSYLASAKTMGKVSTDQFVDMVSDPLYPLVVKPDPDKQQVLAESKSLAKVNSTVALFVALARGKEAKVIDREEFRKRYGI